MRVAFVGKGGSGKSVIAGTASRVLARQAHRVLALDFDTMPGLAYTIGLRGVPDAGLPEELAVRRKKTGWGMRRPIRAATLVRRHAIAGPDGVRFLQLGKLPGGVKPGSSTAFRYVAETFDDPAWHVVGDMPAGTRQPFFGWAKFAAAVVVVVEPSQAAIISARRLRGLRRMMPQAQVGLVVSKARDDTPVEGIAREVELPLWGVVPYDPAVGAAEREGRALIDVAPEGSAAGAIAACVRTLQSLGPREDT